MEDLIKGELDWHNKVNENFHEVDSQMADIMKKNISILSLAKYNPDRTGQNDSTQAWKDIINEAREIAINNNLKNNVIVIIPGGIYKITEQIIIPPFIHIALEGFVIIASYVDNRSTLWITNQEGEPTFQDLMIRQQYLRSPLINGSRGGLLISSELDNQVDNTIALEIGSEVDLGAELPIARYSLSDIAIAKFNESIRMNTKNNYIGSFMRLHLEQNNILMKFGDSDNTFAKNAGENMSFHDCIFAGANIGFEHWCDGFDSNFYGCSFDFIDTLFKFNRGYKKIGIFGGHIEACNLISDATNAHDSASIPKLYINNPKIFCDNLELFKGTQKLVSNDVIWERKQPTNDGMYICDKEVLVNEKSHEMQGHDIALSENLNKINNSKFQSVDNSGGDVAPPFKEFVINSGHFNNIVVTNNIPEGSNYEKALKGISADSTSYLEIQTEKYIIRPGETIQAGFKFYLQATNMRNLTTKLTFYDELDNIILTTGPYADTSNAKINSWQSAFNVPKICPAGASKVACIYGASILAQDEVIYIGELFLGIS